MADEIFSQLSLFKELNDEQGEMLRPLFTPVDGYIDSVLFEQGDPAEYLYLVIEGEVTIRFKPEDGPPLVVTRVKPGGIVGWSAALGSDSYTSGAVCSAYCQLLRVRGEDLRSLCRLYPETGILVLEYLAGVIAQRLKNTHEHVMELLKQGLGHQEQVHQEVR